MPKRDPIPEAERMEIIKSEYVYDVTATNIYFTEDGRRHIYDEYMAGKSPTKIFMGMGLPVSGVLGKRARNIAMTIARDYRKKGTFECKYRRGQRGEPSHPSSESADKRIRELEERLAIKEQELSFLKKITKAAGSAR